MYCKTRGLFVLSITAHSSFMSLGSTWIVYKRVEKRGGLESTANKTFDKIGSLLEFPSWRCG